MSASEAASLEHIVSVAQTYVACETSPRFASVVRYVLKTAPALGTTSILVWDWLACLPQEYQYIWKSRWTPIKFLYMMVRYYTFVVLIVTDIWFFGNWSEADCARDLPILPGMAVLSDFCVELVLALRVFALYDHDLRVAAILGVLLAGFLGTMIAVPVLAFDYVRLPSWPGPCLVTGKASIAGPKFIIAFYAAPMAFDFIVTALTLYRAFFYINIKQTRSSLITTFIRDGVFYYVAISALNLINVIFFVQANKLIESINAPMSIQISMVLSCRLILSLRATRDRHPSAKSFGSTLHKWSDDFHITQPSDTMASSMTLSSPARARRARDRNETETAGVMVRFDDDELLHAPDPEIDDSERGSQRCHSKDRVWDGSADTAPGYVSDTK
ncbi:hypothetical protein PUNSTDRAFT_127828 [Punctularia strigosozonata HHB-11173 SS5]|uniref:uncharacterized protein n=1 Tax=Punctularia strigosozonata (strain HHB-11173) TaxID=741275 RepID=UPI0004418301|nr:uncharacterized protein PUNSTDRAFT_127828 [Punctularia strigosozonata HHB-11173 SS5]EIN05351.1 hypothetical protein PUNSTDRAFT_127828 [Punctularia strigosozonata HHB-11173 SS5]